MHVTVFWFHVSRNPRLQWFFHAQSKWRGCTPVANSMCHMPPVSHLIRYLPTLSTCSWYDAYLLGRSEFLETIWTAWQPWLIWMEFFQSHNPALLLGWPNTSTSKITEEQRMVPIKPRMRDLRSQKAFKHAGPDWTVKPYRIIPLRLTIATANATKQTTQIHHNLLKVFSSL